MKITVETGNWAARYVTERVVSFDMPEKSTVLDLINAVGIPVDEAGIVASNGMGVSKKHLLSDGDTIKIHPVIIGG